MTHAWLFTGPPGSGRSVAARAFAAALECDVPRLRALRRTAAPCCTGRTRDVRTVTPEGLTISVREMRAVVQLAARRPATGPLADRADRGRRPAHRGRVERAAEGRRGAAAAHRLPALRAVDPSGRRVGDDPLPVPGAVRCARRQSDAIAEVLVRRDGIDAADRAVGGVGVGRPRRAARAGWPSTTTAREQRRRVLAIPASLRTVVGRLRRRPASCWRPRRGRRVAASDRRDAAELEELKTALGAGGTGKGAAAAARGSVGVVKELERRQKSRATRTERDVLDRALVDLSGVLPGRDRAQPRLDRPADEPRRGRADATRPPPASVRSARCTRLDAVLACREAIELNVKPQIAVEAMMMALFAGPVRAERLTRRLRDAGRHRTGRTGASHRVP